MTTIDQDLETSLREEIEDLRRAMESRAVIEQAKGVLMAVYQIDEVRAFAILRRWSMHSNLKLRELATALVEVHAGCRRLPGAGDEAQAAVSAALRSAGWAGRGTLATTVLREA
ncbi:MAG: ANTAR domain-containing protein [Aeromicrobium sp.]|jgi:response regulator NasT